MAKDKEEQNSPLDKLKAKIRKSYGKEAIVDFSDESAMSVERLVTSSPKLNNVLGGGVPRGRIIEIYGPESSGKTTLASYIAGQFQANGETVAFIDAEHALDPDYAKTLGFDVKESIFSQPDSGEEALNITKDLADSRLISCIVVDSVAALTPQKELDGEIGDALVGAQARMMSQAMRIMRGKAKASNTTIIFINQIRMKIGIMFGNPETTPGGNALKFYSSIRIDVRKQELLMTEEDNEESSYGILTRYKTVKNKTAPPYRKSVFKVLFGKGLQVEEEWIELAVNAGFIEKAGAGWMTLDSGKKVQGMKCLLAYFEEDPDYKTSLIQKVKDYQSKTQASYVEEEDDEPTDDEVVEEYIITEEELKDV